MPEVVLNKCWGGFGLSQAGMKAYYARKGRPCYVFGRGTKNEYVPSTSTSSYEYYFDVPNPNDLDSKERNAHWLGNPSDKRTDPDLIAVVRELGDAASGDCAKLEIVSVPDGVQWHIEDHDGRERIAENHRTWA